MKRLLVSFVAKNILHNSKNEKEGLYQNCMKTKRLLDSWRLLLLLFVKNIIKKCINAKKKLRRKFLLGLHQ
jgi:hypothetical protein